MNITGHVVKKPMQRDLFTGELVKTPKRGSGDHIKLYRAEDEPTVVPGMAHFPSTGPSNKQCMDCAHCKDLEATKTGRLFTPTPDKKDPWRIEKDACAKATEITGYVQRGGLNNRSACKYFEGRE